MVCVKTGTIGRDTGAEVSFMTILKMASTIGVCGSANGKRRRVEMVLIKALYVLPFSNGEIGKFLETPGSGDAPPSASNSEPNFVVLDGLFGVLFWVLSGTLDGGIVTLAGRGAERVGGVRVMGRTGVADKVGTPDAARMQDPRTDGTIKPSEMCPEGLDEDTGKVLDTGTERPVLSPVLGVDVGRCVDSGSKT